MTFIDSTICHSYHGIAPPSIKHQDDAETINEAILNGTIAIFVENVIG